MTKESKKEENETRFGAPSTECRRCIEILRNVLSKPGSRPTALLEAISGGASGKSNLYSHESGVVFPLNPHDNLERTGGRGPSTPAAILEKEDEDDGVGITSLVRRWTRPRTKSTASGPTVTATSAKPLAASAATDQPSLDALTIECRPCGFTGAEGGARAFVMGPKPLSIVLCSNRLHELGSNISSAAEEMEEVLVHELTHVYDVRKLRLDLQECQQLAYSEVRAAREAECQNFSWAVPQTYCVRQKARTATSNMFPQEGRDCVEQVMQKAMGDRRPFGPNANDSNGGGGGGGTTKASSLRGQNSVSKGERQHFMPYPSER